MNIIFLAYRSWALNVVEAIKEHEKIDSSFLFKSNKDFSSFLETNIQKIDAVFVIGWSDILSDNIVDAYTCVGMHPSDLPNYKGGSPIQNQIIDGITSTKASLFHLTSTLDEGGVYLKESLSLEGDCMDEIFHNIELCSINLFNKFIDAFPNIAPVAQASIDAKTYRRRKPSDSKITIEELQSLDLLALYNKIRSLTNPYPNAYIEDTNGNKLFFSGVRLEDE